MKKVDVITIRDLYPEMSEEQLEGAARNLQRYAEIVWRIRQRQRKAHETLDLTQIPFSSTIQNERSNPQNH